MFSSRARTRQAAGLRPLLFLFAALAALFLLDRVGALVLEAILLQSDDRNARVYAGGRDDDVLILGSSVGNAFANPVQLSEATGERVFSLASHGLDALTQRALVEDYLERSEAPEVALLDVRPTRASLIRAPTFSLFAASGSHMGQLIHERQESLVPWGDVFHLYRFNSEKLPLALQRLVDRDDQATGASDGDITPAIAAAWTSRNQKDERLDPKQVRAFMETLERLEAAGTRPVVVMPPLHPAARFQSEIVREEVLPRLPAGVLLCDFTEVLTEDRFYEDPAHLNSAGRSEMVPYFSAALDMARGQGDAPACEVTGS